MLARQKSMLSITAVQAVMLDGEALENVDKFKYLGSMFVANVQGTEEVRSRINPARSALYRL